MTMKELRKWISVHMPLVSGFALYSVILILLVSDRMIKMDDITACNFNWWISFVYSLFPWTLGAMVPFCVFGKHSRWLYIPMLMVFSVLEAVEWFVRLNFKMVLDGDWIGILMGSSKAEMSWFLGHYLGIVTWIAFAVFVILLWIIVRVVLLARSMRVTRVTLSFGFLFACIFMYANSMITRRFSVFEDLIPVHLIADSFRCYSKYDELAEMKNHPKLPDGICRAKDIGEVVGVVVLGESATRNHMGGYGYKRDTTPNMTRRMDGLVVFKDIVTPASSTADVMRYVFTTRTVEKKGDLRYTMPQAFRSAGFATVLLSNQERWGEFDGDETFDFAGCDSMVFMGEVGETNRHDEAILRYLDSVLEKCSHRQIIFMHLAGSHIPSNDKYPHDGAPFEPEPLKNYFDSLNPAIMQNHYDNSIWYTDKVLERVVEMLERSGKPSWMIYLSDHGDTPSSKNWRTATDRDLWEVPFVVWMSPKFKERHADRAKRMVEASFRSLQSDQLFYGLLDFAGVEGLGNEPSENFLNNEFVPRRPRVICNGNKQYSWK